MTAEIKNIINEFFDGNDPKIYCITGKWGVGKTYLFNEVFEARKKKNEPKSQDCFYISLFGISSIDSLKNKIIFSAVDKNIFKKKDIFNSVSIIMRSR